MKRQVHKAISLAETEHFYQLVYLSQIIASLLQNLDNSHENEMTSTILSELLSLDKAKIRKDIIEIYQLLNKSPILNFVKTTLKILIDSAIFDLKMHETDPERLNYFYDFLENESENL